MQTWLNALKIAIAEEDADKIVELFSAKPPLKERTKNATQNELIQIQQLSQDELVQIQQLSQDELVQIQKLSQDELVQIQQLSQDELVQIQQLSNEALKIMEREKNNLATAIKKIKTAKQFSNPQNPTPAKQKRI